MVLALPWKTGEEFGFASCHRNSSCIAAFLSEQLSAEARRLKDGEGGNSKKPSRPEKPRGLQTRPAHLSLFPGCFRRLAERRKASFCLLEADLLSLWLQMYEAE